MSPEKASLALLTLLVGAGLAAQVGFNGGLRSRIGHPIPAALISFAIGTIALTVYALVTRSPSPLQTVKGPWWIWMGGLVGAIYVASAAAFGPRLGASAWMGLVIAGQVVASLVLDHFGLLDFAVHPVNPGRLIGAACLLVGTALVLIF